MQVSFNLSKKSLSQNKIDEKFVEHLKNILNSNEIFENEMMNKHTTFRTGGSAKIFVNLDSLKGTIFFIFDILLCFIASRHFPKVDKL